jgi:phage gp36-like protein
MCGAIAADRRCDCRLLNTCRERYYAATSLIRVISAGTMNRLGGPQ